MHFHVTNDITDEVFHRSLPPGKNPVRIGSGTGSDVLLNTNLIDSDAGWLYNEGDGVGWKFWPASDGWNIDDIPLRKSTPVLVQSGQTLSCYPCHLTVTIHSGDEAIPEIALRRDLDQRCSNIINDLHTSLLTVLNERGDGNRSDSDRLEEEYILQVEQLIADLADRHTLLPSTSLNRTEAGDHFAAMFLKSRLLRYVVAGDWSEQNRRGSDGQRVSWYLNHSLDRNAEKQVLAAAERAASALELSQQGDMSTRIRRIDARFWDIWKETSETLGPELIRYMFLTQIRKEIKDIMYGLGPLEDLLENPTISEIMVNDADNIFIEKDGMVENSGRRFVKDLEDFIRRIVSRVQRKIDTSEPMVDARLPDGSRVNAIIKPLTVGGPCLTIRRFPVRPLTIDRLVELGALSASARDFLQAAVRMRCNILVAGGTGTGKTTLLNALGAFIPEKERIITIEDTAELRLPKTHVVSLETKLKNVEGKGAVDIRMLVKNALRMRPDRIIVGECRGGEALDMLQAMNTGHDGSMTTLHANTPEDVISRLEVMVQQSADSNLPVSSIHSQIASAIDLIVQLSTEVVADPRRAGERMRRRFVSAITEVVGVDEERGGVYLKTIFRAPSDCPLDPTGFFPTFIEDLISEGGLNLETLLPLHSVSRLTGAGTGAGR